VFGKRNIKTDEVDVSVAQHFVEDLNPQKFDTSAMDRNIIEDAEVESDIEYRKIAKSIVDISNDQLGKQNKSKIDLKESFETFFKWLLSLQLIAIFALLIIKGFFKDFNITDSVLIAVISSVFVESLGIVAVMVKYAFDSEQEVKILEILKELIKNYQKYIDTHR